SLVARRVLPHAVQQLHDGAGRLRLPHVVVDRHAMGVDESPRVTGHVAHSGLLAASERRASRTHPGDRRMMDAMSQMFRSFATRNYRIWFAGALVSNVGTWMQRIAQDWLVLAELTDDDAIAVGVVMALQFGPQLVLLPVTGWVADRFDRRHVLAVTQASMMLLGAGL